MGWSQRRTMGVSIVYSDVINLPRRWGGRGEEGGGGGGKAPTQRFCLVVALGFSRFWEGEKKGGGKKGRTEIYRCFVAPIGKKRYHIQSGLCWKKGRGGERGILWFLGYKIFEPFTNNN